MQTSIKKVGNSSGILLSKPMLAELGALTGDTVDIVIANGQLIITIAPSRNGWAEDAQAIAQAGDDKLAWPEFPNAQDDDLQW